MSEAVVDDIVRASRTSKGAVYHHFPNKEALFLALVDEFSARLAKVDEIVFAVTRKKLDEMKQIFLMCEELGIRTRVAMNIFQNRVARLEVEEIENRTKDPGVAVGLAWTPAGGEVLFVGGPAGVANDRLAHGRDAQGDVGLQLGLVPVYVFVMVLGFSRMRYDDSESAISGPAQIAHLARFFEAVYLGDMWVIEIRACRSRRSSAVCPKNCSIPG